MISKYGLSLIFKYNFLGKQRLKFSLKLNSNLSSSTWRAISLQIQTPWETVTQWLCLATQVDSRALRQGLKINTTKGWTGRRQWHPTPVLLPGKSHERRSLLGCSPWGREESDTTERLHFHVHALEKEMATHSSILAWRIPGTGEPGGLPSMGSHRVGHEWSGLAAAGKEKDNLSTLWSSLLHISRSDVFMHMAALGNCQDVCPSSAAINRNPRVTILPLMMTSKRKKKKVGGTASRETESVARAWKP